VLLLINCEGKSEDLLLLYGIDGSFGRLRSRMMGRRF
jgi:hypothetical protein